ncbi:hypothetical protein [Streptomyces sp. NPDC060031]|uniref:hypothetical protein n=1 Tax=Streptomyces sp. NPDC060031 TaxID=3347043 RepID=UPI003685B577
MLLLCAEFSFGTAALLDHVPRGGPVQWAAAVATGLALVAQIVWLDLDDRLREGGAARVDPLAERLAAQGPHPALVELAERDPQGVTRLRISRMRTRRGRNRGRPRRRVERVERVERGARP